MKYQILIEIIYMLLARDKVSAKAIAERFDISLRTTYRYLQEIELANVPLLVERGANGGFSIAETFKMPCGFLTEKEYAKLIGLIDAFQSQLGNSSEMEAIKDKLNSSVKNSSNASLYSNQLIIDGGDWIGNESFKSKLAVITKAINNTKTLDIAYHDREGTKTERRIEPYALVLKQGIWYVYAFCLLRNDFRLFKIGRIEYATPKDTYKRREFDAPTLSFNKWFASQKLYSFRFELTPAAMPDVIEWLGVENVKTLKDGRIIATSRLPYDRGLIYQILKFGSGIRVLKPEFIREEIKDELNRLQKIYND